MEDCLIDLLAVGGYLLYLLIQGFGIILLHFVNILEQPLHDMSFPTLNLLQALPDPAIPAQKPVDLPQNELEFFLLLVGKHIEHAPFPVIHNLNHTPAYTHNLHLTFQVVLRFLVEEARNLGLYALAVGHKLLQFLALLRVTVGNWRVCQFGQFRVELQQFLAFWAFGIMHRFKYISPTASDIIITQYQYIRIVKQIMIQQPQLQPTTLNITILALASTQTLLYTLLLALCLHRLILSIKSRVVVIQNFYILLLTFILLLLFLSVYQVVMLAIGNGAVGLADIVLGLVVFSMIADLFVLVVFTGYWKQVQGSFVFGANGRVQDCCGGARFVVPIGWFLCYTGYFLYLVISGHLTQNQQQQQLSQLDQILLYIVSQAVSQLLLVICSVWQTYHWCRLQTTIESFQKLVPYTMNKKRFKALFWSTTIFNSLRILLITYLILLAWWHNYNDLMIAINCYTLAAGVPIFFYFFGFKSQGDSEMSQDLLRREAESEKSKKSSSAHETELSYHSGSTAKSAK